MKLTNEIVIQKAKACGFDLVGFAAASELGDEIKRLQDWLERGYQAGMSYMEKNIDKRKDVLNVLQNARSIISLGLNYFHNENFSGNNEAGKVSRYAWGKDYHLIIREKLSLLENELKEIDETFESKSYVDTGPIMDKSWAVKSGVGWLGKHSNVINKEFGSWFFIATIITNYEFAYSSPIPDFCGKCTACLEACPTDAIVNPYVVDANKCISYLTIENKKEIPDEFKEKFDNWIFGCDICQVVCPWNIKFAQETSSEEFHSVENKELNLKDIINMGEEEFKIRFNNSPIKRAKLSGIKRNVIFLKKAED